MRLYALLALCALCGCSAPRSQPAPVSAPPTAVQTATLATPAPAVPQVWVNLRTGIYHSPGSRWYGKTKDGAYMAEADAQNKGYRLAANGQ